jgi:hypothetical protein
MLSNVESRKGGANTLSVNTPGCVEARKTFEFEGLKFSLTIDNIKKAFDVLTSHKKKGGKAIKVNKTKGIAHLIVLHFIPPESKPTKREQKENVAYFKKSCSESGINTDAKAVNDFCDLIRKGRYPNTENERYFASSASVAEGMCGSNLKKHKNDVLSTKNKSVKSVSKSSSDVDVSESLSKKREVPDSWDEDEEEERTVPDSWDEDEEEEKTVPDSWDEEKTVPDSWDENEDKDEDVNDSKPTITELSLTEGVKIYRYDTEHAECSTNFTSVEFLCEKCHAVNNSNSNPLLLRYSGNTAFCSHFDKQETNELLEKFIYKK